MKNILLILISSTILICDCKDNKDVNQYLDLYKYLINNNRYEVFNNATFVKRKETNMYLYHDDYYKVDYWFSLNFEDSIGIDFDGISLQDNLDHLKKEFQDSAQIIEKKLMNDIYLSAYLVKNYNLSSISGWMTTDSIQIIDFTYPDSSDLVYWSKVNTQKITSFFENKIIKQIDRNWFYIRKN